MRNDESFLFALSAIGNRCRHAYCLLLVLSLALWCLAFRCAGSCRGGAGRRSDACPPLVRSLITNGNPYQFRNYSNGGAMSLSADGKRLLMSSNGLMLWGLGDRNQARDSLVPSIPDNQMYNSAGALAPDGKTRGRRAHLHGSDMAVRCFNTKTGKLIREIDNDQQIVGWHSPNGQLLAVSTQQTHRTMESGQWRGSASPFRASNGILDC